MHRVSKSQQVCVTYNTLSNRFLALDQYRCLVPTVSENPIPISAWRCIDLSKLADARCKAGAIKI